mmetsp:Transcript_40990/g.108337  ORF Transcript_40990/g.108337 Transcript_40990/m.108337 type:complete len:561 (+) Transcript_40990:33-1715(+)
MHGRCRVLVIVLQCQWIACTYIGSRAQVLSARVGNLQCITPGRWSMERQAAYNEAVTRQVLARGGHGGDGQALAGDMEGGRSGETLVGAYADKAAADDRRRLWQGNVSAGAEVPEPPTSTAYHCELCALHFDRKKQLEEHLAGKKHQAALLAASEHWDAFQRGSWHEPSLSTQEHREIVTRAFSLEEFTSGLPSRSRAASSGIAPHVTISSLAPRKRLMLWRYFRDLMPSRPLLPEVFAELARRHGRYARVKEILESAMVYAHVEQAILRSDPSTILKRGKVQPQQGREYEPRLRRLLDVACGHGLVGLLTAYRFPQLEVIGIDRAERPAHAAYVDAWQAAHHAHCLATGQVTEPAGRLATPIWDGGAPLINVRLLEGDLLEILTEVTSSDEGDYGGEGDEGNDETDEGGLSSLVDERTLVLCVHGCNEVNVQAVELARDACASWLIMPCCLQTDLYLKLDSIRLLDEAHYNFLCGAMAVSYGASRVVSLDARVTPRSIVLSGGDQGHHGQQGLHRAEAAAAATRLTARGDALPNTRGGAVTAAGPLPVPGRRRAIAPKG